MNHLIHMNMYGDADGAMSDRNKFLLLQGLPGNPGLTGPKGEKVSALLPAVPAVHLEVCGFPSNFSNGIFIFLEIMSFSSWY